MNVKLHGGLGNQLFQFAFGRSMSAKMSVPVTFDRSDFIAMQNYQLDAWSMVMEFDNVVPFWADDSRVFHEPGDKVGYFNPTVYDKPLDTCFRGFWQTEQYFDADVAKNYRRELSLPKGPMPEDVERIAGEIKSARKSAFISVRRGDYLTPFLSQIFGCLDMQYYRTARRYIETTIGFDTKFFVFSDDPEYCRTHFGAATIIDHRQPNENIRLWPTAPWDLYLMGLCQHGVISNSSFAWWGAWIGDTADRIVVAPDPWFSQVESSGVVPPRWMRVEATIL